MLAQSERGDTLVEVIVAFTVFALVSVGAIMVMNRGITMTDRSLEITLVREQIDAQAEILRYMRDTQAPEWQTVRANAVASSGDNCPTTPPNEAFIAGVSSAGNITYTRFNSVANSYAQPGTYSQFTVGDGSPKSYGMWVVPVRVQGTTDTYDMHIRACWYAPGDTVPTTLGTIVRLYET